jgi:hypothetical protein
MLREPLNRQGDQRFTVGIYAVGGLIVEGSPATGEFGVCEIELLRPERKAGCQMTVFLAADELAVQFNGLLLGESAAKWSRSSEG